MNEPTKHKEAIKASTWSAILTLFGFLIVTASIAYSTLQLNSLEKEKKEKIKEVRQLDERKKKLEEDITALKTEAKYYEEVLLLIKQERPDLVEKAAANPEVEKIETKIKPRVYIHLQDTSQVDLAKRVELALIELGFLVPEAEELVEKAPQNTYVRYFRKKE